MPEFYITDKFFVGLNQCFLGIELALRGANMSRCMGKPTICIGEKKGTDQLRSNCEADQRLSFRF